MRLSSARKSAINEHSKHSNTRLRSSMSGWKWLATTISMAVMMAALFPSVAYAQQGDVAAAMPVDLTGQTPKPPPIIPGIKNISTQTTTTTTTTATSSSSNSAKQSPAPEDIDRIIITTNTTGTTNTTDSPLPKKGNSNSGNGKSKINQEAVIIIASVLGAAAFAALVLTVMFKRYKARDLRRRSRAVDSDDLHGGWKPHNPFVDMTPTKPNLRYLNY